MSTCCAELNQRAVHALRRLPVWTAVSIASVALATGACFVWCWGCSAVVMPLTYAVASVLPSNEVGHAIAGTLACLTWCFAVCTGLQTAVRVVVRWAWPDDPI